MIIEAIGKVLIWGGGISLLFAFLALIDKAVEKISARRIKSRA